MSAKNAAKKLSPMPGKRRKPTLFAAIKGSFTEAKKMWQNRYKNIAKFITKFTKIWGQLLYKVQKKMEQNRPKIGANPKKCPFGHLQFENRFCYNGDVKRVADA